MFINIYYTCYGVMIFQYRYTLLGNNYGTGFYSLCVRRNVFNAANDEFADNVSHLNSVQNYHPPPSF